jgi:hypothetical protein
MTEKLFLEILSIFDKIHCLVLKKCNEIKCLVDKKCFCYLWLCEIAIFVSIVCRFQMLMTEGVLCSMIISYESYHDWIQTELNWYKFLVYISILKLSFIPIHYDESRFTLMNFITLLLWTSIRSALLLLFV